MRAVHRRAVRADANETERRDWRECFPDSSTPMATWSEAHPDEIAVAPYADLPLTFRQSRIERDGAITTWVGRSAELPGGSFVGVARPGGGYDGILLIPGASQFFFHVRDGMVRVEESVASGQDCGVGDWPRRAVATEGSHVHYAEASDAARQGVGSETFSATAAPLNADVLFLYNAHALTVAQQRSTDPIGYIDGYSRASLETCNQALENSRVGAFRWRFIDSRRRRVIRIGRRWARRCACSRPRGRWEIS